MCTPRSTWTSCTAAPARQAPLRASAKAAVRTPLSLFLCRPCACAGTLQVATQHAVVLLMQVAAVAELAPLALLPNWLVQNRVCQCHRYRRKIW